jgi:hypothetical protein
MKKFTKILPYIIISLCVFLLFIDSPKQELNREVVHNTLVSADGIGNTLATRATNVLIESKILVMNQSDYWYEKRKLILSVIILLNIFYIAYREFNQMKAYQYELCKETNMIVLDVASSNGDSYE